jgi:hypothetical protein
MSNFKSFKTADKAYAEIEKLYSKSIKALKKSFDDFAAGKIPSKKVTAY